MSTASAQSYARIAGTLLLITIFAGSFGEVYVPSKIVASDAATTLHNIQTSNLLFRTGFASYLAEAICDTSLALVFYVLLKPVSKNIALLSAFFALISTASFVFGEFFYFSPAMLALGDGSSAANHIATWSSEQQAAFTQSALTLYGQGATAFGVFYGIETILRGYLMFRSGYLPQFLGTLLVLGGLGFVAKNFIFVLAPAYDSPFFALPMFAAIVPLTGWLLVKGVDLEGWQRHNLETMAH